MKLVIAEKPSVARDIARVLGARQRQQGFMEGNGYRVTWALGHLIHFAEPDEYGNHWKGRWSFRQLPMVPQQWKLKTHAKTGRLCPRRAPEARSAARKGRAFKGPRLIVRLAEDR